MGGCGGLGVVLAALDSYQTHTHNPLSAQYTYCMYVRIYECVELSLIHSFTSPPHSMVHHLTDQLPPVMVDEDAVIVTETAKYIPSPVLSLFTCPHEAGHSMALLGYARLTYRVCSRPYLSSVVPVLCNVDVITAAPPTVVMSSLQPHPQWGCHHCSSTHSDDVITAAPPTHHASAMSCHWSLAELT